MSFDMHGIQIDENRYCNDVQMTMDTLHLDITEEQDQSNYTGQSLHSLAHANYTDT